jgi:anti-anti-sigma factor
MSEEDTEPSQPESLRVAARYGDTEVTLVVEGSLDRSSSERFRAWVDEALGGRPRSIVVDARALTAVDSSGLAALLRARHAAIEAGVAFRLSDPSSALRHAVDVAGFQALLPEE